MNKKKIFNIMKKNADGVTPDVWENIKSSDEPNLVYYENAESRQKIYPIVMRWIALTACFIFVVGLSVSVIPSYLKNKNENIVLENKVLIEKINQTGVLPKFASYDEMLAHLKAMNVIRDGSFFNFGGVINDAIGQKTAELAPESTEKSQRSDTDSVSSTNTQVSGVDEGDIIKNDGQYLYIASNNKISIVSAYPVSELKNIGQIKLSDNEQIKEIYLTGNILTVIGYKYEYSATSGGAVEPAGGAEEKAIAPDYYYGGSQTTIAKVYDISNKSAPTLKRELSFEGTVLSTREKDGKFYIVTNKYLSTYATDVKPEQILPMYSDSVIGNDDIRIEAKNIEYCTNNLSANYLLISVFDINNENPVTVETILGAGSNLYMSNNSLYIVQPYYRQETQKSSAQTSQDGNTAVTSIAMYDEGTVIMKFNIADSGVKFAVAGEVSGQILNQYSMDEYNDTFRIATTKWSQNGTVNNLYVLNGELKITGKVEGLAPGETIKAVRFVEKTGYIVTFRNMDPLFVVDLSDPNAPKVLGELKIPGFSNYLHPIGNNKLIGIGQNTTETYAKDKNGKEVVIGNQQSGLKVSLFDVSDPKNPKELDSMALGGAGSYSEVQNNPKAFLWWNNKSTVMFPASIYGVDGSVGYSYGSASDGGILVGVNGDSLVEKGRIMPENVYVGANYMTRLAYINDTVYLSKYGMLYSYDYNTLTENGRLALG